MIGLDDWPANPPPARPVLTPAQEILVRMQCAREEIDNQSAQLATCAEAGNYGQARTAALCLATAAQVYVQLTNALQKTDQ